MDMMATSMKNIEKHLECSICMETLLDPHWLKCGHKFCLHCILPLVRDNKVSCPTCRKYTPRRNLCKDYDTARLVQMLKDNRPMDTGLPHCVTCQDPDKSATNMCQVCEEMMCPECTKAHRGSKATRDHTINSLVDIFNDFKTGIKGRIQHLKGILKDLKVKYTENNEALENLEIESNITCSFIDDKIDQMINTIEDYRLKLIKQVMDNYFEHSQALSGCNAAIVEKIHDTEAKISAMQAVINTHDLDALKQCLNNLNSDDPNIPRIILPQKYIVKTTRDFDASKFIALDTLLDFKCLYGINFRLSKRLNDFYIYRLCVMNGNLLVTSEFTNGISVYNQTGNKLNEIHHDNILIPCGMCTTQNSLIVSSKSGLHQINPDFYYQNWISPDSYYDVCLYQERLFALKFKPVSVDIFTTIGNKWRLEKTLLCSNLQFNPYKVPCYNRIYVNDHGVTISTYYGVYKYTHGGQLLRFIQYTNDEDANVFLCALDDCDTHMYVDNCNKILQLNRANYLYVAPLPKSVMWTRDVKLDQRTGVLWLGAVDGLFKLTI